VNGRRFVLLTGLLLLAIAPPAIGGAGSVKSANFTARISGTYTASGTVTNTSCYRVDANDNQIPFTGSGSASETTSFRSTRGALLGVSKMVNERRIVAGGFAIPVTATMSRSSTLDGSTEPQGCKPNSFPLRSTCGRKTKRYGIAVYARRQDNRLSYNLSSGYSTTFPEDPFQCPLVEGADWWGRYYSRTNGAGPVSVAKLFNRRVRTIVVKGALKKSPQRSSASEGYSASSTETLSWTLTLTRRG
jgi:hypothetical protein